jgi:CheY-like chemotaxis protein
MNDYRLLIVDDDRAIRETLRAALEDEGFTVAVAANGAEAMAKMRERPPRLVLLDLMMPVLDGFGVLARMREDPSLAKVRVCICSAISGWAALGGAGARVDFVLRKPVGVNDVMGVVARVA